MVLQNKHKQLASRRWNKARGNAIKKQESGRTQQTGRQAGSSSLTEVNSASEEDGSHNGEDEEEHEEEEEEEGEAFPDLPVAGSSTSHMKLPTSRPRPSSKAAVPAQFARRPLQSNADRYAEPEVDPYEDGPVEPTSEEERDAHSQSILAHRRLNPPSSPSPSDSSDGSDIDHELLSRLASTNLRRPGTGRSHPRDGGRAGVRVLPANLVEEEGGKMERMKEEKEKADAVADVKARLLGGRFSEPPRLGDRSVRLGFAARGGSGAVLGGGRGGLRGSGGKSLVGGGGEKGLHEAEEVDDFLNSL